MSEPYLTKRNGMNIIRAIYKSGKIHISCEVMSNVYGRGYINPKPDNIPQEVWDDWIIKAEKLQEDVYDNR